MIVTTKITKTHKFCKAIKAQKEFCFVVSSTNCQGKKSQAHLLKKYLFANN